MIEIAKTAGFCFGVDRGVKMVYDLLNKGQKVCTLGPIIHNPQVVGDLAQKGVRIVKSAAEVGKDETLVIRSHGVKRDIYEYIHKNKIKFEDATCPFVKRIHKIVKKESENGKIILIAGDSSHPEVIGIRGHCLGKSYVFSTPSNLRELLEIYGNFVDNALILVSQTTFNLALWRKCIEIVKKLCTNVKIFDTICNATSIRQKEATSLADRVDLLVVVGGKCSSNTKKLFNLCKTRCKTFWVETADELRGFDLGSLPPQIGITAGASTPAQIIKEVHEVMSEKLNEELKNVECPDNSSEENFAEMLEQSGQQAVYGVGKKVRGVVTAVLKNEVQVDIGGKQAGVIPASELSVDSSLKTEDVLEKDDEVDLIVTKNNDQDGIVTLSKKRYDASKGYEMLLEAMEQDKALNGVITDAVKGGVLAITCGVKIFIPISQLSERKVEDATGFIGKAVDFKVLDVNVNKYRAVGSVRKFLDELKQLKAEKIWKEISVGDVRTGVVKSMTGYGVFVDLGGVDGMIHISELAWNRVKHPSDVVSVGDEVEVVVKSLDKDNGKISLSYRKEADNPWNVFIKNYSVGQVVEAKIYSIKSFGIFVEVIPGVDGLIHISQLSDRHIGLISDVFSVGQVVRAKIWEIDYDSKRVSLSIRALMENEARKEANENLRAVEKIEGVEVSNGGVAVR